VLHTGVALPSHRHYLPSTPEHLLWGRLPCETDADLVQCVHARIRKSDFGAAQ
jgi:hypothetical protein